MNWKQRAALQAAVDQLNAVMADIRKSGGDKVIIRPWANFNTDEGVANIQVEITTGREVFRS
jgi:hypothetical protein